MAGLSWPTNNRFFQLLLALKLYIIPYFNLSLLNENKLLLTITSSCSTLIVNYQSHLTQNVLIIPSFFGGCQTNLIYPFSLDIWDPSMILPAPSPIYQLEPSKCQLLWMPILNGKRPKSPEAHVVMYTGLISHYEKYRSHAHPKPLQEGLYRGLI